VASELRADLKRLQREIDSAAWRNVVIDKNSGRARANPCGFGERRHPRGRPSAAKNA